MSLNRPYGTIEEIPQIIPIFPLAGAVLLPRSELPLNIFEPRYLALVDSAIATENGIASVFGRSQRDRVTNIIERAAHPNAREELREAAATMGLL